MSDAKYCKDCKNMSCPESRVSCKYPDAIACDLYRDTPPTLFNHITVDEETLAEKLVILSYIPKKIPLTDIRGRSIGYKSVLRPVWKSGVTEEIYSKKAEALAATVKKLKEVCNE